MPTLLDALAADLLTWPRLAPDGVVRRVVLWLDPAREFACLVPHLAPGLEQRGAQLLAFAPEDGRGQLVLKLDLLRLASASHATEADAAPAVVYLPSFGHDALEPRSDGALPGLWALYEYRFVGCVWGRGARWELGELPRPYRLYEWLRAHGLELPSDNGRTTRELADGGAASLLARYAELRRDTDPATWPRPLRLDDVRDALAGDPRSRLRELFASPANALRVWPDSDLVLDRLATDFGFTILPAVVALVNSGKNGTSAGDGTASSGKNGNPLADTLAIQLALAEAWDAFGRPDDFPYRDALPARSDQRAQQIAFVRDDLMASRHLAPLFFRRMLRLEPDHPLATWAAERSGQPAALPLLARQRWQTALAAFNDAAAKSQSAALAWLAAHRADLHAAAAGPWDATGSSAWGVLAQLDTLATQTAEVRAELNGIGDAAALIHAYTDRWWHLDVAHLEIRDACTRMPGLDRARAVADTTLFTYASAAAEAFTSVVESQGSWPPDELTGVAQIHDALWSTGGRRRRAVIISDALRWDLAERVREHLAAHGTPVEQVELRPVISTLPTITPFGMTALLPLDPLSADTDSSLVAGTTCTVTYTGGKPTIKDGAGRTLSTRAGRKALLEAALHGSDGKPIVAFRDMDDLLAGAATIPEALPLLVVFDRDIDQLGHMAGDQFPSLAIELAANLARTITLLHQASFTEVHVVTDHGFLLLPHAEVDVLGHPAVPLAQALHRDHRWAALKPDAPTQEVLRLRCPLDPDGPLLGFPRGVRTLQAAEPYEHGGISLQECVLPYLVSRVAETPSRLEVTVHVTRHDLTTGTVPVVLAPAPGASQATLWSESRPVTVRLWVEVAGSGAEGGGLLAGACVAGPIEVEVRADGDELRPALYLDEGLPQPLPAGQELVLRASDAATGRHLAAISLALRIPWE